MRIAVLGAGSWGTTLAIMLVKQGHRVILWEFRPVFAKLLNVERENRETLPGFPFPDGLLATSNIHEAIEDCEFCLLVVPSHAMRATIQRLPEGPPPGVPLICASKGIEEGSLMRMSEVLADVWSSGFDPGMFVCLSGPSHAEEVVRRMPTSVVAASSNLNTARRVQELMSGERFRVYSHDDLVGVELGGSLKNVIAIAAGIADGLGFGDNAKGALLTRGQTEMSRLGVKLGGRAETFAGLSGIGDLITTCCSKHSRNRYVGEEIGKGRRLQEVVGGMVMVAEGVKTTASAWALALREGINMPITEQVHHILFENADPMQATVELMTRKLKVED